MSWEKLKTFLILLFLCINIFLIATTLHTVYTGATISHDTIIDAVAILAESGIRINPDIIPRSADYMQNLELTNVRYCNTALSEDSEEPQGFLHQELAGDEPLKQQTKALSKKLGLCYAVFEETTSGMALTQKIDGYWLFDSHVSVSREGQMLLMKGVWYVPENKPRKMGGADQEMAYITGILVDFIHNPDRASDENEITAIDFGYRIPAYESGMIHKSVSAVPCYRLTTQTQVYYYDAKTGEYMP